MDGRYDPPPPVAGPGAARIRVVALDLMDTVVRDPFREAVEAATGLSIGEVLARRDPTAYPAFEAGAIDEATYWEAYASVGIDVDRGRFHDLRRAGTVWLPGMPELLDELGGRVVRATASNYPVWIEELAARLLRDRFDVILSSHHLGVRKPEAAFYEAVLERLGCAAAEVAFVDDRAENVDAAVAAGLHAVRFTDAASLRRWLVRLGVLGRARPVGESSPGRQRVGDRAGQ